MKRFNWKRVAFTKPEPKFDAIPICRFYTSLLLCGYGCFCLSMKSDSSSFLLHDHIIRCKISALMFPFPPPVASLCRVLSNAQTTLIIALKSVRDFTTLELFSNLTFQKFYLTWLMTFIAFFVLFFRSRNPWCSDKRWFRNTTSFICCVKHTLQLIKHIASSHVKISFANFNIFGSDF